MNIWRAATLLIALASAAKVVGMEQKDEKKDRYTDEFTGFKLGQRYKPKQKPQLSTASESASEAPDYSKMISFRAPHGEGYCFIPVENKPVVVAAQRLTDKTNNKDQ